MVALLSSVFSRGFMDIIGRGMIAKSFTPFQSEYPDVILFATGTANSQLPSIDDYYSEYDELCRAIQRCQREKKRLVYFSSAGAVYKVSDELKDETTPVFPTTAYGRHKLLCEAVLQRSRIRHLIIRLANLVGHSQNPAQLIPALYEQIKRGHVTLHQLATRDILDVADCVSVTRRLLGSHLADDLVLLTSGQSVSILELFETLQRFMGRNLTPSLLDRGDQQRFSIAKLQGILPDVHFPPHYYKSVLQRFVTAYRLD